MAQLVRDDKENNNWLLSGPNFAMQTAGMDHSRNDFGIIIPFSINCKKINSSFY